jgi:hydrogenase nickel incorporation protein HypA/HybF
VHEFSICSALLSQLSAIATQHGAERVTGIRLRIGALAGVEPELLARAFALAREGTVAAHAELSVVTTAVTIACRRCGHRSETAANRLTCPRCGDFDVEVVDGQDLILESVELEIAPEGEPDAPLAGVACHV